jgi:hypothetical protein
MWTDETPYYSRSLQPQRSQAHDIKRRDTCGGCGTNRFGMQIRSQWFVANGKGTIDALAQAAQLSSSFFRARQPSYMPGDFFSLSMLLKINLADRQLR